MSLIIFLIALFPLIPAPEFNPEVTHVFDINFNQGNPTPNSGMGTYPGWQPDYSPGGRRMFAQDRSLDDDDTDDSISDDQDFPDNQQSSFRIPGLHTAGKAMKWGASAVKSAVSSTIGGVTSRALVTKDKMSGMVPRLGQRLGQIGKDVELENWRYRVRGKFLCGEHESNGTETQVKLMSYGLRKLVTMAKLRIKKDGTFKLSGFAIRKLPPNPFLHIYTTCNNAGQTCARRWRIKLPDEYIMDKGVEHDGYYIGEFNLFTKYPGEDTSCNH